MNGFDLSAIDGLLRQFVDEHSDGVKRAVKAGGSGNIAGVGTLKTIIVEKCRYLKDVMLANIHNYIPSFPAEAIIIDAPIDEPDGYRINIWFNQDALWRPSMCQNPDIAKTWRNYSVRDGKYGTDDIVLQFEKGWNARNSFWARIDNKFAFTVPHHAPGNMIRDAVRAFNSYSSDGIRASVGDRYV